MSSRFGHCLAVFFVSLSCLPVPAETPSVADDPVNYFMIRYLPGENWNQSISYEQQPGLKSHHEYLRSLYLKDQVLMAGPVKDAAGGLALVRTGSLEEAQALVRQDPGVVTMILKTVITPWAVQMSSVRFARRQPMVPIKDPEQSFKLKRVDPESRLNLEK